MPSLSQRVPTLQLIAFVIPAIPVAMILGPLNNILPAYYAAHTAASLTAIGTILGLTRLSDAVLDQLIGYLSDITRSRLGRRKPWILAGSLVLGVSGYFLFTPSPDSGAAYFFTTVLLLYLGYSMVMVPLQAWGSELSREYGERARITTFNSVALGLGGLAIFAVPFLPIFQTTEIGAAVLQFMAYSFLIVLPAAALLAAIVVPQGQPVSIETPGLGETLRAVARNKPFRSFAALMVASAIALGIVNILLFLYISKYLQLGARIPHVFLTAMLVGLATMPLWLRIVRKIGKHRALALSGLLSLVLLPFLWVMRPGDFWGFLAWMIALALAGGAGSVAPAAIMGDIVDYDILVTRRNHAGNYFAFIGLMQKSVGAVGGALAFWALDAFGFDAKAATIDEASRMGLLLTMTIVPGLLTVVTMLLAWNFPIDARRHDIIRRRLEARARREQNVARSDVAAGAVPASVQ